MASSTTDRIRAGRVSPYGCLGARPYRAIVLLLGCLYLPYLGAIPLGGTLEANRLEAAREMLRSGDWVVPHLGDQIYLAKPPLFPWTVAILSAPFGNVSATSGRLVTVLCAVALCCIVFAWGRRELGKRAGLYAALALGGSLLFAEKAIRAELEIELALLTSLALFGLWMAVRSDRPALATRYSLASGLALGAAGLVKGPPALLVYGVCAGAMLACGGVARRAIAMHVALALGLAVACLAAWVLPVCDRLGFQVAWSAFQDEFLRRITSPGRTNVEPAWFYAPALLVGLLPAALHLPCLALVVPGGRSGGEKDSLRSVFLWSWALLPVLLFSLSSGKETRYLLATFPAWTLLLAWGWRRARASRRLLGWRRILRLGVGFLRWFVPLSWIAFGVFRFPDARAAVAASGLAILLFCFVCVRSVRSAKPALLLAALATTICVGKFAWASTVLADARRNDPIEEVRAAIESRVAPAEPWILVGPYRSWLAFPIDRPCVHFIDWDAWRESSSRSSARWALARESSSGPEIGEAMFVVRWLVDDTPYCLYELR